LVPLDKLAMAKRKSTDQVQLNVRMRESLRAKLEQSAKKNYESLNREVVDRLERSFDRQDLLVEALSMTYGKRLAGILMIVGRAMEEAGRQAGFATDLRRSSDSWMEVPFAYREAATAAALVLNAFRPPGEVTVPSPVYTGIINAVREDIGLHEADRLVEAVKKKAPPDLRSWASTVRELLDTEGDDG
jgi:hypothetical protein